MSPSNLKHAVTEGLKLAKGSFVIFLIYYFFNVLIYVHSTEFPEYLKYALFYLPVYIGFVCSVPSLLDAIRKSKLTAGRLLKDTLTSLWRLIIPMSVFVFLIVAPIVYLYENNPAMLRNFLLDVQKQQSDFAITDYLSSAIILSLFSFTTCFFSLEKRNVISAVFRSIGVTIQNPFYLLILVFVSFIEIIIRNELEFDTLIGNILFAIPTTYLVVVIASSNVVYFREVIQKPSESEAPSQIPIIRWLQTSSPSRNMALVLFVLVLFYFLSVNATGTVPPGIGE